MKAAVFRGPRDVAVEELERPKLLPGDLLIRVTACGICGSDLHIYKHGLFPQAIGVPVASGFVLGHENSGEVVEICGEVDGFKVGDRVSCAISGGNAEYLRVPAAWIGAVLHTPANVSDEEASTSDPLACSIHGVHLVDPAPSQSAVVIGAGVIGLGVIQVLRALFTPKILIGVDLSDKRLAMAEEVGADAVVNPVREELLPRIFELTGSNPTTPEEWLTAGADFVFDCAGAGRDGEGIPPLQQALLVTREKGSIVLLSVSERPVEIETNIIMRKGIRLIGSYGWNIEEFAEALELMRTGRVNRKRLITHEFSLDEAPKAYETQTNTQESIKVLLKPWK